MKRLIALLIALCLLIPMLALAQADLKGMTDDQLIQLYNGLVSELFTRGKSATIPVGIYKVGTHIPAGDYSIEAGKSMMGSWTEVDNEGESYGSSHQLYMLQPGQSVGRLILKDGDVLEVSMGEAVFTSLKAVLFEFK